jgi:hypothetical protein
MMVAVLDEMTAVRKVEWLVEWTVEKSVVEWVDRLV